MKLLYCLVITLYLFPLYLTQNVEENEIDGEDQSNPLFDAASEFLKGQNMDNIGGMIGDFIETGGGKQLGDMLMSGLSGKEDVSQQILKNLGSVLKSKDGGGFDPSIVTNLLSMLNTKEGKDSIQNTGLSFMDMVEYANMFTQTMESFVGPSAIEREKQHAGHAWMLPPLVEKLHVMFDHFMHSELGKTIINRFGAEKFVQVFKDETGRYSYRKFVDMLENHSFRRHWIHMFTSRILDYIAYFADPYTQKNFMSTTTFFVNSLLKSQGLPKSALFDTQRPTESLNALLNYITKKFLNTKYNFKPYIKPAVQYTQEIIGLAEEKGFLGRGINAQAISNKLTDTINLELIEPIARVNRAYRFLLKHPKCDMYVFCLINQISPDDQDSLPALKKMLYRVFSTAASWFISERSGTSFLKLYTMITDGDNCQDKFRDECNDFHIEEIKVTTEYVHTEL